MKTKGFRTNGFTFVEIILLTSMATTAIYDVAHTLMNIKDQYQNIQNIMAVHSVVAQAKMNYATDLALLISNPSNPSNQQEAQQEIGRWNQWANDNGQLIARLINPDPSLPVPLNPLTPGSKSYLPTSHTAKIAGKYDKTTGKPIINYVVVPITDITSLLQAFQLTNDQTPTGNIVATITVGPMLDVTNPTRPTLPIVDWMPGTLQEIEF